jgi:hypothetical protein
MGSHAHAKGDMPFSIHVEQENNQEYATLKRRKGR